MRKRPDARCGGFTLMEVLAALAIAFVIILATTGLIRNVAREFDRGTRGVNEAERLMLAVERLARISARRVSSCGPRGADRRWPLRPRGRAPRRQPRSSSSETEASWPDLKERRSSP